MEPNIPYGGVYGTLMGSTEVITKGTTRSLTFGNRVVDMGSNGPAVDAEFSVSADVGLLDDPAPLGGALDAVRNSDAWIGHGLDAHDGSVTIASALELSSCTHKLILNDLPQKTSLNDLCLGSYDQ